MRSMEETDDITPVRGLTWEDLCADSTLQDLPFKIELNEWGQVVMSPTNNRNGYLRFKIGSLLEKAVSQPGELVTECAIRTSKGTKVADVAWFSAERWAVVKDEFDSSIAPEICIEVRTPRNSEAEMTRKRELYFESGAVEVWECDDEGRLRFFSREGVLERSALVSNFPNCLPV